MAFISKKVEDNIHNVFSSFYYDPICSASPR